MVNLAQLARPRRVSIFARVPGDPTFSSRLVAFILQDTFITDPQRVTLDLSKERGHSRQYQWTRAPVEVVTTDNAIRQPDELTVNGTLSATPLGGVVPVALGAFGSFVRRDLQEVNKLRAIADRRLPVAVVTPERTYGSMGIASIDERHGAGNKVDLTIRFVEVRIVSPLFADAADMDTLLAGVFGENAMGTQPVAAGPAPAGVAGGLG